MPSEASEEVGKNKEDDKGDNTSTSHEVEVPVDGDKHIELIIRTLSQDFVILFSVSCIRVLHFHILKTACLLLPILVKTTLSCNHHVQP